MPLFVNCFDNPTWCRTLLSSPLTRATEAAIEFCLVQEEESSVHAVAFSPDGQYIVVTLAFLFSKFQFQGLPAVHGPRSEHAQVGCGDKSVKACFSARELCFLVQGSRVLFRFCTRRETMHNSQIQSFEPNWHCCYKPKNALKWVGLWHFRYPAAAVFICTPWHASSDS